MNKDKKIKVYKFILKEYSLNFPTKTGEFKRDFNIIQHLGQGGYGKVFKVEKKIDNETYAVKRVKIKFDGSDGMSIQNVLHFYFHINIYNFSCLLLSFLCLQTLREVSQLAKCQPLNIVRYYTAWLEIENAPSNFDSLEDLTSSGSSQSTTSLPFLCMYIQTEYCHGTLEDWLEKRDEKSIPGILEMKIIRNILLALEHIHEKNIMHRDIKPSNIFTIGDYPNVIVKLGDFGLARDLNETFQEEVNLTLHVGSAMYAAPETNTSNYNCSSDIFSLGIIALELFGSIFSRHELCDKIYHLKHKRILPNDIRKNFPLISEMILKMTCPKIEDRPTAKYLIDSCVFTESEINENNICYLNRIHLLLDIIKIQRDEIEMLRSKIGSTLL